ncbi:NTP transferase domain-containing protein [Candidatus Woesearchaeota archaeon]|jgi:UTP-glucose-1-phosphate uridylyltransferase|nr:NTP transferase domain-containing protein [Candidatus Woesearchaeota archaeon]MBT4368009.1 NTP transferase domain-containing protein [Candidatus Woesearchaeota archaeon]MBT4712497.1 NTP transferase domain-containing protein [Candidatus Woesearchaeota archaeon]MBT6639410.1 NTP transferase domain-containing protein [Candidatus Woesearchaeota archaeon]MBT7133582.1 NTP transferase domain-containing protein [Candidatus Woesearchaeota archaeon]
MTKVKKAIIPAAGIGSRLFPYTKHINKLMLPILNKPIIQYLVDELVDSGIEEIIITGRYLKAIKEYFRATPQLLEITRKLGQRGSLSKLKTAKRKCKITFVKQNKPTGWMFEVYNARKFLKDNFIVVFSDLLYHSRTPAAKQAINVFNKKETNIHASGRFVFTPNLIKILSKINFKAGEDLKTVNKVLKILRNRDELTDVEIKGTCFNVGSVSEYYNTFTLLGKKELKK